MISQPALKVTLGIRSSCPAPLLIYLSVWKRRNHKHLLQEQPGQASRWTTACWTAASEGISRMGNIYMTMLTNSLLPAWHAITQGLFRVSFTLSSYANPSLSRQWGNQAARLLWLTARIPSSLQVLIWYSQRTVLTSSQRIPIMSFGVFFNVAQLLVSGFVWSDPGVLGRPVLCAAGWVSGVPSYQCQLLSLGNRTRGILWGFAHHSQPDRDFGITWLQKEKTESGSEIKPNLWTYFLGTICGRSKSVVEYKTFATLSCKI